MAFAYTKLMQAMVAAGVVTPTDPYFNLVTLLLPGNGTNGAQNNTFLDSSTNNFTITRNGNTTQGTFSPFSQTGWGNYFNGSSTLTVPANTAFVFGTGDFTVELWIYQTAAWNINNLLNNISAGNTSWNIEVSSGNIYFSGYNIAFLNGGTQPSINAWHHVAVCRSGTTLSMFIDGVRTGTTTDSTNFSANNTLSIGGSSLYFANGYISNVRLVKGTAVYNPSSSTCTVPTSPLTAISGTSILTCQSNRFVDNSSNAFAVSVGTGTPSVQAFSPFAPTAAYSAATNGGSGYFDGSGDYLTVPAGSAFAYGTGQYTVEAWVYLTTYSAEPRIFAQTASAIEYFTLLVDSTGKVAHGTNAGTSQTVVSSGTLPLNSWVHIAAVREGTGTNQTKLYINGVNDGTGTISGNFTNTTYVPTIGRYTHAASQHVTGYISDFRVVKGSAVYTSNFTPPTAPLTNITNTSLLLNFTNAGITDATAKNIFETVGNASISTAQSKFGGGSMFFDGTGDYLTLGTTTARSSSIQVNSIGTANATIEMWVYSSNSSSSLKCLIDTRSGQGTDTGYGIYQIANNVVIYGNGVKGNAAGQLAGNTWTHLAVTRANTTNYVFIGGTLYNTFTYGNTLTSSNVTIASDVAGSNAFTGYIDDLRITNGYARYTANFTPTTTTFPLQ